MIRLLWALLPQLVFMCAVFVGSARGHEEGAPFSGAIIDPLKVHHAHIEDEQRINFARLDGFAGGNGDGRSAYFGNLELAVSWTDDFRLGSEVLIPVSSAGNDENRFGVGDIELWPLKYVFINKPETIMTGVLSVGLPTGSESKGLGKGHTTLGASFLFDQAYRNWFWGLNVGAEAAFSSETETELEVATVMSYSFIRETQDVAPTKPRQSIVPAISLEVISESVLRGEEEGENIVTLLPGINLWHPKSGWSARLGVEIPISSEKKNDFAMLLQFGNHRTWGRLLGR